VVGVADFCRDEDHRGAAGTGSCETAPGKRVSASRAKPRHLDGSGLLRETGLTNLKFGVSRLPQVLITEREIVVCQGKCRVTVEHAPQQLACTFISAAVERDAGFEYTEDG
jgi:hypothetical protein